MKTKDSNSEIELKIRLDLPNSIHTSRDFAIECGNVLSDKYILFRKDETSNLFIVSKTKSKDSYYKILKEANTIDVLHAIETFVQGVVYSTKGEMRKAKIPFQLIREIYQSEDFIEQLPKISSIINTPLPVIKNGELKLLHRGYNPEYEIWVNDDSYQISNPDMLIEDAKDVLEYLFGDFCFATEQDKSNAIASFITPFIRGLSEDNEPYSFLSPIWLYEANRERAGKDYLAGMTSILYTGNKSVFSPISSMRSEELNKQITSMLLKGEIILHSGNNRGKLKSSILESLSTSTIFNGRILGKNEMVKLKNNLMISLSANKGFRYTPDLENRMIRISLFYPEENPNDRVFKNPMLDHWVEKNGDLLLSAIYSLVRVWFRKGKPKPSKHYTSFFEWGEICGGIMESAGYLNPFNEKPKDDIGGDDLGNEMKFLYEECYKKFGTTKVSIDDIREFINDSDNVFEYKNFVEDSDKKYFSNLIVKYTNRIESGIKLLYITKNPHIKRRKFIFCPLDEVDLITEIHEKHNKN